MNGGGREALVDAVRWYHRQLDRPIDDHTDAGEHPDRPDTAREYWHERGYTDETIERALLGWAPPDVEGTGVLEHLVERGHTREAIAASGLFSECRDGSLYPLWSGRYVFAYLDADGRPAFAISRSTDADGERAHPDDRKGQKYDKLPVSWDTVTVEEPIYGIDSVRDGEPVLITEGIADAIAAQQAGYPCLSPVTITFKHTDRERLLDVIDDHDVPRAYVIQDAEPPSSDLDEKGRLTLTQFGEGERGGVTTAAFLAEHGDVDARVGELPRPGLDKVDLDDYLLEWAGEGGLDPILASAKPASEHPAYESIPRHRWDDGSDETGSAATTATAEASEARPRSTPSPNRRGYNGESDSALFDLSILDVAGLSEDYRGTNPLGHHGESENYFVVIEGGGEAYDHKYKATYTALTYLLCEAGERPVNAPSGELSDDEIYLAWCEAKRQGHLPADDPVPFRGVRGAAVRHGLVDVDEFVEKDSEDGGTYLTFPRRETHDAALVAIDEDGFDHGWSPRLPSEGESEHIDDGGRDSLPGRQFPVETCAPPEYDPEPFDREERWRELKERYSEWVGDGRPVRVFGDPPGTGKSTNVPLAGTEHDRSHAVLFDKHAKAREFITDEATPDGYIHAKGGEQPRHDCCMDAAVDADEDEKPECPTHGHPAAWPLMNPIYERDKDDSVRQAYEVLLSVVGERGALFLLDEDGELVDENPWLDQFDALASAERVVGVHEYQTLKTVREGESGDERDVILDETPRLLASEHRVSVEDLVRVESRLDDLADLRPRDDPLAHNFRELARFAARVRDAIVDDGPGALENVESPTLIWDRYESWDPAAGEYVEDVEPDEDWKVGEAAAQLKLAYNESTVRRVQDGEWNGEPFCMDSLLAAAATAGLPDEDLRRAVAIPSTLDECPWCESDLGFDNGARCCTVCGWHERENGVTTNDGEAARAIAWIDDDPVTIDRDEEPALAFKSLPNTGDLPTPLVLDATATPKKVAAFYGVPVEDVEVEGDAPLDLDGKLRVTQVLDGQYHPGTIEDSETAQRRIQNVADATGEFYDRPLFMRKKDHGRLFDFPENGEGLPPGGARGLNRAGCGAVVSIGAPHLNGDDLRRDAELLAMDRNDLDAGGGEYSTRRGEDGELAAEPPIYRKLLYADENGEGRAVPTKHYSGLMGALFYEGREKEIVQDVHRARPLLVDPDEGEEPIDVFLLTNVPTDLPVDKVCTFDELADDLSAIFPVADGALDLLGAVRDVAAGDGPDGFRANQLVEQRDDGTIANNRRRLTELARLAGVTARGKDTPPSYETVCEWVDQLEAVGLLTPGKYEQRRGVVYEADPATLNSALQFLSRNGFSKVAAVRRFREKVARSDGSLDWLAWAEAVFDLGGNRCEWDPPPTSGT